MAEDLNTRIADRLVELAYVLDDKHLPVEARVAYVKRELALAAKELLAAHGVGVPVKAAPPEWLENVEAELRKVPGLDEKDIEVLTAMASAGFDYAAALKQREARPICQYTGKRCRYEGAQCTCHPHGVTVDAATDEAAFQRGKRRGYTDGYYAAEVAARPVLQDALDMLRTERYGNTDPDKRERTIERIERFINGAPGVRAVEAPSWQSKVMDRLAFERGVAAMRNVAVSVIRARHESGYSCDPWKLVEAIRDAKEPTDPCGVLVPDGKTK